MSIIIKGITKAQFYKDANKIPYMDVGWDIEELPPHGRLIDADALRQDLKDSIDECHNWADAVEPDTTMYARISQAFGTFVECSLRVKAAPTIIEAEEEEE